MLERLQSALKTVKDSKRNYFAAIRRLCIASLSVFITEECAATCERSSSKMFACPYCVCICMCIHVWVSMAY